MADRPANTTGKAVSSPGRGSKRTDLNPSNRPMRIATGQAYVPDREKIAWAAGFFVGEGTTGVGHRQRSNGLEARPRLSIHQVEREPLERFQDAFGGRGSITGPYVNGGVQPIHKLYVSRFEDVQFVVAAMWPWLSPVKRAQATRALQATKESFLNAPVRTKAACKNGHLYLEHAKVSSGKRQCRVCANASAKRRYHERYASDPDYVEKRRAAGRATYYRRKETLCG